VILVDANSSALTMTLPSAVGIAGRTYTIKKIDSSANTVTINTTSSQTIDTGTTSYLNSQSQYINVISDGAGWYVTGGNAASGSVQFVMTDVNNSATSTLITSSTVTSTGAGSLPVTVTGSGSPQI